MKIPDNFILLCFAVVLIGIGWFVPTNTAAAQMLAQLWAIMLVLLKSDQPMMPYSAGGTTTISSSISKQSEEVTVPVNAKVVDAPVKKEDNCGMPVQVYSGPPIA